MVRVNCRVQVPCSWSPMSVLHTSAISVSFWRWNDTSVKRIHTIIHQWSTKGQRWRLRSCLPVLWCVDYFGMLWKATAARERVYERGVGTKETSERQERSPLRHSFHPVTGILFFFFINSRLHCFLSCCWKHTLDGWEIHPESPPAVETVILWVNAAIIFQS